MPICPICLQSVENLKSGSHVIPKWAMKLTKEGTGTYASLDFKDENVPKAIRIQSDLICDFWCEACEIRFRNDDANGARFFRNKKYMDRVIKSDLSSGYLGIEIHHSSAVCDLRSFIVSLFLRLDVYSRRIHKKSVLGNRFSFYAKAHADNSLDTDSASLILFRILLLGESHSSSVKIRFGRRNCVKMVFCGYDIFMISDKRGPEDLEFSSLISHHGIFIPVYDGTQLPYINKVFKKIQQIGSAGKEPNFFLEVQNAYKNLK